MSREGRGDTLSAVRLGPLAAIVGAMLALSACSSSSRPGLVEVVQTDLSHSQQLTRLPNLRFGTGSTRGLSVIHVDDAIRYQRVVGVGAAITDTSAWLLHDELSPAAGAAVMRNLYGAGGIHLSYALVPMGASDFTKEGTPYSYDDLPPGQSDPGLSRFSVAHDDAYIVPVLRQLLANNPHVGIMATEWSPPAWMKANRLLSDRAGLGTLLPGAYHELAQYFVKFIRAYASRGIQIDAISPQNEPGQKSLYPGLNLSEPEEARFVSRYLAPALAGAGLHPAIYGHDYKWLFSPRAVALVSDPAVARSLSGIAWHCYDGNPTAMTMLHGLAPGLDQIESECSPGSAPGPSAELMIASFRNWASTVLLWNLALDPGHGPVQHPSFGCARCTGVITVDERTHTASYSSDYYELGQFSAFVRPGARRIGSENFVRYNTRTPRHRVGYATAGLDDVAFINPDRSIVLLTHNTAARGSARFAVAWHRRTFTYALPAGATATFTWR